MKMNIAGTFMNKGRTALALLLALSAFAIIIGLVTRQSVPPPTTSPAAVMSPLCGEWQVLPAATLGSSVTLYQITDMATTSNDDIWIVGSSTDYVGTSEVQPLVTHWDGTHLSVAPSPIFSDAEKVFLFGIDAISTNDIWAVGSSDIMGNQWSLTMHWDGVKWEIIPSPNSGSKQNVLSEVEALAKDDVWAVGFIQNEDVRMRTIVEHWDGTEWSIVPSPNPGNGDVNLYGVVAVSRDNVWVVGSYDNAGVEQTLTMNWDGKSWHIVPSPNQCSGRNTLTGIAALDASNIWTVGSCKNISDNSPSGPLIEHWDGTEWSIVPSPNPGSEDRFLTGVAAIAQNNIWAVGFQGNSPASQESFSLHWDGTNWSMISKPKVTSAGMFSSVSTSPEGIIWASGRVGNDLLLTRLNEGPCADQTP